MCKLTILQYTQCECNAFDGNSGDGFIVTKPWHNRLTLDRDTVPFKRCTQAKCSALNPSRSHTLEFPRCQDVQVTTIRFTGEVCFRCLMHRRLKERAVASRALRGDIEERGERLCALFAQRKSFASRYEASRISAAVEVGPTGELWQSIRISSQFEGERSNEGKDFAATIRDLRATQLKPLKQLEAGWEEVLEKQMACREIKKQRKLRIGSKKASYRKMMESEIVARQARLSLVKEMLAYFNKRVASKESGYTESLPLIDEETKQEASFEPQPARRFRVARPKKHPLVVSPALDLPALILPAQPQRRKSSFFDNPGQRNRILKDWSSCGYIPSVTTKPPSWTKDCTQIFENAEAAVRFHAASTIISAHKPSTLSADVAEFKPFLGTPPTAPRMMRVPTAPRAMRQASTLGRANSSSLPRSMQRSQLAYGTFQGYRAVHGYGVAHGYALSYGYGLEPGFQSVQGYATVRRW